MKNITKSILSLLFLTLLCHFKANAQATRTWVSGVGDDANPCSRTAPCKTFAGAISKTAAGGEINTLDPGGFGAVTITKSITLSSIGFEAGVLVSSTNGIIINAAATDVIFLKGLNLEGLGQSAYGFTSPNGINILSAKAVVIENCDIKAFQTGIIVAPTVNPVSVIIKNTSISNTNTVGVNVSPAGVILADVNLINVLLSINNVGINATGINATVRVANSSIVNNTTGISSSTGKVISFGNNIIAGNTNNNKVFVMSQL
jgi:hypothetical protein